MRHAWETTTTTVWPCLCRLLTIRGKAAERLAPKRLAGSVQLPFPFQTWILHAQLGRRKFTSSSWARVGIRRSWQPRAASVGVGSEHRRGTGGSALRLRTGQANSILSVCARPLYTLGRVSGLGRVQTQTGAVDGVAHAPGCVAASGRAAYKAPGPPAPRAVPPGTQPRPDGHPQPLNLPSPCIS